MDDRAGAEGSGLPPLPEDRETPSGGSTLGTRDAVEQVCGTNVVNARADLIVAAQDTVHGTGLFARETDRCCAMRKVAPLKAPLAGYDA